MEEGLRFKLVSQESGIDERRPPLKSLPGTIPEPDSSLADNVIYYWQPKLVETARVAR